LTYFLPRFPDRERSFVTQTTIITAIFSAICLSALILAKPLVLKITSYDFIVALAAYVFFFVNLNWLEYYWIAKRQPRPVLVYSAVRLSVRIGILLLVAYLTRDIPTILWSLVAVEAVRILLVFLFLMWRGIFVSDLRRTEIMEQLSFAGPIGAAGLAQQAGKNIGKIFISGALGPAALAFYAVGSYLQPVVRVTRSGIEDAIFPELVRAHAEPGGAVRLWQRVNVLNCALFFPGFVLLVFYAQTIVTTLFTSAYLAAVPIFSIFAIFLLRKCFNTDVLLRTAGSTGFVLVGTVGALAANIALIVLLAPMLGMIGPAVAFIAAEIMLECYFAYRARKSLGLTVAELADWTSVFRIAISCVLALPILFGFELLPGPVLARLVAASMLYFLIVLLAGYCLGVKDIGRVVRFLWMRLGGR
jgi:O-antigen/teichoic acid export membrane protein